MSIGRLGAGFHIGLYRPDIEAFMIREVLENEVVETVSTSSFDI